MNLVPAPGAAITADDFLKLCKGHRHDALTLLAHGTTNGAWFHVGLAVGTLGLKRKRAKAFIPMTSFGCSECSGLSLTNLTRGTRLLLRSKLFWTGEEIMDTRDEGCQRRSRRLSAKPLSAVMG